MASQHHGVVTATLDWLVYGLFYLGENQLYITKPLSFRISPSSNQMQSLTETSRFLKIPLSHHKVPSPEDLSHEGMTSHIIFGQQVGGT